MKYNERLRTIDHLTQIRLEAERAYTMVGDIHNDCFENKTDDLTAEQLFSITHAPVKSDIAQSCLHTVLELCEKAEAELEEEKAIEDAYRKDAAASSAWTGLPKDVEYR